MEPSQMNLADKEGTFILKEPFLFFLVLFILSSKFWLLSYQELVGGQTLDPPDRTAAPFVCLPLDWNQLDFHHQNQHQGELANCDISVIQRLKTWGKSHLRNQVIHINEESDIFKAFWLQLFFFTQVDIISVFKICFKIQLVYWSKYLLWHHFIDVETVL